MRKLACYQNYLVDFNQSLHNYKDHEVLFLVIVVEVVTHTTVVSLISDTVDTTVTILPNHAEPP